MYESVKCFFFFDVMPMRLFEAAAGPSLPQPVHGLPDPGLTEAGLELVDDLVDEEVGDAGAGALGLVEGVPQLLDGVEVGARVGVARVPRRGRRVAAVAGVELEEMMIFI